MDSVEETLYPPKALKVRELLSAMWKELCMVINLPSLTCNCYCGIILGVSGHGHNVHLPGNLAIGKVIHM